MKLIDAKIKLEKYIMYETYIRLVYEYKDYDNITRKKMLEEIIDIYHEKQYMNYLLTKKEVDFITKYYKTKEKIDKKKYEWEIKELSSKYILDEDKLVFYEEYDDVIPELIDANRNKEKIDFSLSMFIVSFTRMMGEALTLPLFQIAEKVYRVTEEEFNVFLNSPIVHFYCELTTEKIQGKDFLNIYYRDYEDMLPQLRESRKKLAVAGCLELEKKLYEDFYYYGLNYSNPIVKEMYDKIKKNTYSQFIFKYVEELRLFGEKPDKNLIEKFNCQFIEEAIKEIPSAAMNGLSPNKRKEFLEEESELDEKFTIIPQNNAHLHKEKAKKYYRYYFALLEYINNKYKINPNVTSIFEKEKMLPENLIEIDNYLFTHKEEIDNFIKENPFNFKEEEFQYVEQFKTATEETQFIYIGTEREYAKFLSATGKIYMVKGLNSDLDEVLSPDNLPYFIETHLLMFEGKIIYNGMISVVKDIKLGNEFKKTVIKEIKNSIPYYHL